MLLAQIGNPPPTVYDRSIVITLTRKNTTDQVEALSQDERLLLSELARKAARWTADNTASIAAARPAALANVSDRASDNWRALFAVAEIAGGDWAERARTAAYLLADMVGHDASSVGEMLIADMYKVFTGTQDRKLDAPLERMS